MGDELEKLQSEWRANVLKQLNDLAEGQKEINKTLSTMATQASLDKLDIKHTNENLKLETRISALESFAWKLVGGILLLNILIGFCIEYFRK
jgi:hypothetical protein